MKYYAVVKGKETGVFSAEWDDIKHLVVGFPGAVYKGFSKKEDADKFFFNKGSLVKVSSISSPENTAKIYATGEICSHNGTQAFKVCGAYEYQGKIFSVTSWSWLSDYAHDTKEESAGYLTDLDITCYAIVNVLSKAFQQGIRDFMILSCSDIFEGWSNRGWKARSVPAKYFQNVVSALRNEYKVTVNFDKFTASRFSTLNAHVVQLLKKDLCEDDYTTFGFKSTL